MGDYDEENAITPKFDRVYDQRVFMQFLRLLPHLSIDVKQLIRIETAAKLLWVSRQTIQSWIKAGKLRPIKIDGITFLDRQQVRSFTPLWTRPDRRAQKGKPRFLPNSGLPEFKEQSKTEIENAREWIAVPMLASTK